MESSLYIGGDMVLEIFSWLPAKSIIKYTSSLSKTLSTLRIESMFIQRQSFRSSLLDNGFFLQHETSFDKLDFFVLPNELPSLFGIPDESFIFLTQNGRVSASSQGLVLLHKIVDDVNQILICNPVTRSYAQLPIPDKFNSQGFRDFGILLECHPRNLNFPDDYTVILPVSVEEENNPWGSEYHLAVYRNGKWDDDLCYLKREKGRDLCLDAPVGVFRGDIGGLVVHYICKSLPCASRNPVYLEPYVMAYDVEKKELWRTIKLPQGAWTDGGDHAKLKIFKWGSDETIALLRRDRGMLSLWVLEDYASSSWNPVMSKTTSEIGVTEENDVVRCCVFNMRRLVFSTKTGVYVYDIEAERVELVGEHDSHEFPNVMFMPYANTLRPVSVGETTSVVTF